MRRKTNQLRAGLDRATRVAAAKLVLFVLLIAATLLPLDAQTSAPPTDSVARHAEARRLAARADTLARGSAADRRAAVDLLRQAAAWYTKAGARHDAADALLTIGQVFSRLSQPDSALAYYGQAWSISRVIRDRALEAETLTSVGEVYYGLGQPDSAFAYFRQALPLHRSIGARAGQAATLIGLGLAFERVGQLDSALASLREAASIDRAISDRAGEARALNAIGVVFYRLGQPDSVLAYFGQALPIFEAVGDRVGEANDLNNMGVIFGSIGQLDAALAYYRRALPVRRAVGDRVGESATLANIGLVFDGLGQPDSALAYDREALRLSRVVGNQATEAQLLNNIGAIDYRLGQPDSALDYFRQALSIRRTTGDRIGQAETLSGIGAVYSGIDQPDSALAYYRQAAPIQRTVGDRAGEATTLGNIGELFGLVGRPDSALAYYRQALPIMRAAGVRAGEANLLHNLGTVLADLGQPDSSLAYFREALSMRRGAGDRIGEAQTLYGTAFTYRRIGRLESAVMYFEQAAATLATIAKRTGSDFNQTSFNETSARTYADWTLTWLASAHGGDTVARARAAAAALATSERGRAQALAQLMGVSREIPPGADLVAEGQALAIRLVKSAGGALVYVVARDTLITWLILPGGAIVATEQAVPSARLDTLVAAMRYGVAAGDATPNRGRGELLHPTPLPPAIRDRARADSGRTLRRELSALLVPPAIRARLPAHGDLIVIPQGQLGLVPFGLLPVSADTLLGSRYALRYAPSLAASAAAEDRVGLSAGQDRAGQLAPALIVGDPTMPTPFQLDGRTYALGDLPGARDEGRAVADSLGTTRWLTGNAATETAVLAQLSAARLVHLATHGLVYSSDAHARLSFIALGPDAQHDGHLSIATIVDSLTLHADLVVLSACQTAVGNVKSAEGTLGLQRAMLAKGARSVLVSLWNVSDESTLFLVQRFYHHWLHDAPAVTKSEALRLAQADVQAEARNPQHPDHAAWGDPFYWAAFQLVGAP